MKREQSSLANEASSCHFMRTELNKVMLMQHRSSPESFKADFLFSQQDGKVHVALHGLNCILVIWQLIGMHSHEQC